MIDQVQFNILVTNVFAIAEQVFARQCKLFLQTMAEDESAGFSPEAAGLQDFEAEVDYQLVLDNGYGALESVTDSFAAAWDKADKILLQESLAQLPPQLPNLLYKINGEVLENWVNCVAALPEENAFSRIHQYCQGLFHSQGQGRDFIREAIADDDVTILEQNESEIALEEILFEDINTALMIESVKTFTWLAERAQLSDEQRLTMLEYVISDQPYFERVYQTLAPSAAVKTALIATARESGYAAVLEFLQSQ